jgi:fermentation-respiration switch protein FrsA (DUF1100 family)
VDHVSHRVLVLLRRVAVAAIVAVLFWTIVLMIFEEKFIYFPHRYPRGLYEDARSVPHLRDCWMTAEDGVKIHGWFAPADSALATVVISHGNGGNISYCLPIMRELQRRRLNVLMYDYRGYGRSEGSPDEEGIYRDGRAAFDYALKLPEVDPRRVILWGASLGGAVAIDVATQRPAAALILESTFSSAKDVARSVYPFLPARFFLRTKFNSVEKIRSIKIPLLFIHGSHDSIIPIRLGRRLFSAAQEPKEFYEIPGANHNDTFFVGGAAYFDRIIHFVLTALPPPKRSAS